MLGNCILTTNQKKSVIAKRVYSTSSARKVTVTMAAPEPARRGEWHTRITVSGLEERHSFSVIGVDAFSSIENSINAIRVFLEPYVNDLIWKYSSPQDSGFGKVISSALNKSLNNVLFEAVDTAWEKSIDQAKRAQRKKSKSSRKA